MGSRRRSLLGSKRSGGAGSDDTESSDLQSEEAVAAGAPAPAPLAEAAPAMPVPAVTPPAPAPPEPPAAPIPPFVPAPVAAAPPEDPPHRRPSLDHDVAIESTPAPASRWNDPQSDMGEDPLTDPSAAGPFAPEPARRAPPTDADLLSAPVRPPPAMEAAPAARPAAPRAEAPPEPDPAPRHDAWGEGWDPRSNPQPNTPLADAPVARDLFAGGGFEELEEIAPPTEELPSGVMEDVGQSYQTPYSVPEPPPIPGIVDRFTPPPTQRTDLGDRKRKPDYLADTPGGANRYEATPAPSAKRKVAPRDADDEPARGGPPAMLLMVGLGAVGLLGLGLILVAVVLFLGSGSGSSDEGGGLQPAPVGGSVETRDDMRRKPPPLGETPTEAPTPAPVEPAPAAPVEPAPPEPAPPTPVQPKPGVPTPAPPKPPPVKPAPAAPAPAAQGVLKIRANRRAMVYVNNQVVGFTPLDHKVGPGTFSVAAVLPGQPTTRQERSVSVGAAGGTSAVDFTF